MTYTKLLTIIVTILAVSCNSTKIKKVQDASENIPKEAFKSDLHADAIKKSNPELKPHTDAIKASNKAIRTDSATLSSYIIELQNEIDDKGSLFRTVVPFIPILVGVLSIIFGRLTNDISDTIFGGLIFLLGIVIHIYWGLIGFIGCIILLGLIISWAVISQESKAEKKRKKEMYP